MKKLLIIISFLNIFFSCKEVKQNITSKSEQTIEDKGQDKIFVESIELKIDSIKLKNEYYKIGRISDSDGYTNLRERPNSKSKILSKIVDVEYFFYNPIKVLEWSAVKTLKKEEGYIHNSRIVEIKNDELISVSIFDYILGNIESTKDTIVNISSFNDSATFLPNDFNYEKIEKNEFINDSTIIFSDANSKITISKQLFKIENNNIEYEDNYISLINGNKPWGVENTPPQYSVSNISINDETISKIEIQDLFQPNLGQIKVYKTNNKYIIWMLNGDGAAAYSVIFFIEENTVLNRFIYLPF